MLINTTWLDYWVHKSIFSVVVKDLRLKDKDLTSKDEDLKIGPRGEGLLEDNNTVHFHDTVKKLNEQKQKHNNHHKMNFK